ncbi:nuclear pore complex protein Nup50 [Morone saxatilis]|uniref:nuclear pore complex protein Nup50 n=1 Tax=Morone saxatilis TaxID=34816 RepID=UPI0015E1F905|nr:nuclear pore complex protein Nup50 [Morone saxatilis]
MRIYRYVKWRRERGSFKTAVFYLKRRLINICEPVSGTRSGPGISHRTAHRVSHRSRSEFTFPKKRAGGMAKRIADKELTDRNWDQEEEGEEAGTFSVASEDVLKNRAIKKAKRRNIGAEGESSGSFKGFKGFSLSGTAASGGSTPTAFSGFGNGGGFKGLSSLTNGNSIAPSFGGFSSPSATTATPGEDRLSVNVLIIG